MSTLQSDKAAKATESFKKKMTRQAILSLGACVHCGQCTESCHYYLVTLDPKMAPAYKADQVRKIYKKHFDWLGRVFPSWVGGKDLEKDEDLLDLMDVVFGSCTMCRRCTLSCPMGVDKALIMRTARGVLTELGIAPEGVKQVAKDQWETGNQMAVSKEEYLETLDWLSDQLESELGDPFARIPIDKRGVDILYAVNPREVKYAPLSLLAVAKIFYVVGASWTMPSEGWDNTNFGLFNGDNALGAHMGNLVFDACERLEVKRLVTSECGHGFRSTAWESPNWTKRDLKFPILNVLEVVDGYIRDGKLTFDRSVNDIAVTYHDPCNLARSSGFTEEPRRVLKHCVADFREMHPNRADNFCCSGGGGAMSMSEYTRRRLEVSKVKADQLRATGASVVATACHNCIDGLSDCIRHHKVGMKVSTVCELAAEALVVAPREFVPVRVPVAAEAGRLILVVDDEPDIGTYLTTLFENEGLEPVWVDNAEVAWKAVVTNPPDLITLDILMPGKSGISFYRRLRTTEETKDIPVVFITGCNPASGHIDARKYLYSRSQLPPPEGFLDKPVDRQELMLTIRKILEMRSQVRVT
ncbi:MAG: response regulator [Planctomycetota bacterium]